VSGEELLKKTRSFNGLLQASAGRTLSLSALVRLLGENIGGHIFLLDDGGRILGCRLTGKFACESLRGTVQQRDAGLPASFVGFLSAAEGTRANLPQQGRECVLGLASSCRWDDVLLAAVPVLGAGVRLGSLVLSRCGRRFTAADLVLAELGATMAGAEMIRRRRDRLQTAQRERAGVQLAMAALSNAERDAVRRIMPVLVSGPGLVVTTEVARQMGCTRSVVVNALHKLKSAGVIESRSQGMKGTYVKLLNENLAREVDRPECRRKQAGGGTNRRSFPGRAETMPAIIE